MTSRDANIAVITALMGLNPTIDDKVDDIVAERLGLEVFSDEAVAIMAEEYQRLFLEPAQASPAGGH